MEKSASELALTSLDHPMTLKIFVNFKLQYPQEIGTREMQRLVGLNSPSTVNWHFNKLVESGYIVKSSSKKYHLTDLGIAYDNVKLPVDVSTQFFMGRFVSKYSLLLSVLVSGLLVNIFLLILDFDPFLVAISSIVIIAIAILLVIHEWYGFQKGFREYFQKTE
ncbi:MAG: winged helix-turn-helix domain-containing protein [Candidatus Heimdallarchaeota archaeon]|nr:winged helix-turn-helix domain-containing protein [Candidatus Heimdallarchaeota archaeon]